MDVKEEALDPLVEEEVGVVVVEEEEVEALLVEDPERVEEVVVAEVAVVVEGHLEVVEVEDRYRREKRKVESALEGVEEEEVQQTHLEAVVAVGGNEEA